MNPRVALLVALTCCGTSPQVAVAAKSPPLPPGFVYLSDVAPTIVQDIRYAGPHNFLGRRVAGYLAPVCVLPERTARALQSVQHELVAVGLTLRVYDCYRPQRAVADMVAWSKNPLDQTLKAEYYPRVGKTRLLALGYVARKPANARGGAVDLTIQRLPVQPEAPWTPGEHSCVAPFLARYHDGSIDMGTNYDCLDPLARVDARMGGFAGAHREILRDVMEKRGFTQSPADPWWHFTLKSEPFPQTYFDFPVRSK